MHQYQLYFHAIPNASEASKQFFRDTQSGLLNTGWCHIFAHLRDSICLSLSTNKKFEILLSRKASIEKDMAGG
jgi:hypothetical protein